MVESREKIIKKGREFYLRLLKRIDNGEKIDVRMSLGSFFMSKGLPMRELSPEELSYVWEGDPKENKRNELVGWLKSTAGAALVTAALVNNIPGCNNKSRVEETGDPKPPITQIDNGDEGR